MLNLPKHPNFLAGAIGDIAAAVEAVTVGSTVRSVAFDNVLIGLTLAA